MQLQLFEGMLEPSEALFLPAKTGKAPMIQKPEGGLWTSSYDPVYGSAWIQWGLMEEFRGPKFNCWLLKPKKDARILTIDSLADLKQALYDYGFDFKLGETFILRSLDFNRLAEEFDGVHLTERGNGQVHHSFPESLNGWDCESTIWLQWVFDEVKLLGHDMTFPSFYDGD